MPKGKGKKKSTQRGSKKSKDPSKRKSSAIDSPSSTSAHANWTNGLPAPTLQHLFSFLSLNKQITHVQSTCRNWHTVIQSKLKVEKNDSTALTARASIGNLFISDDSDTLNGLITSSMRDVFNDVSINLGYCSSRLLVTALPYLKCIQTLQMNVNDGMRIMMSEEFNEDEYDYSYAEMRETLSCALIAFNSADRLPLTALTLVTKAFDGSVVEHLGSLCHLSLFALDGTEEVTKTNARH